MGKLALMKIHADKIESLPPHSLRVRDVKLILASVPSNWITELKEVRLANSLEYYSPYAFFSRYDGCLTIYSRCGTKKQALIAVLSALAANSFGIKTYLGCRLSESDRHRLDQLMQPLADNLLVALTPVKPSTKLSPEAHTPMHFAPFPNDAA